MSRIQKTICDRCNKEIDYEKWFYNADIASQSNSCQEAEQIAKGDFCKECFKEIIAKIK